MAEVFIVVTFLPFYFSFMTTCIRMLNISKTAMLSPWYKDPMAPTVFYSFLDIQGIFRLVDRDYSDLVFPVVSWICLLIKCDSILSPWIVDIGIRAEFPAHSMATSLVLFFHITIKSLSGYLWAVEKQASGNTFKTFPQ